MFCKDGNARCHSLSNNVRQQKIEKIPKKNTIQKNILADPISKDSLIQDLHDSVALSNPEKSTEKPHEMSVEKDVFEDATTIVDREGEQKKQDDISKQHTSYFGNLRAAFEQVTKLHQYGRVVK